MLAGEFSRAAGADHQRGRRMHTDIGGSPLRRIRMIESRGLLEIQRSLLDDGPTAIGIGSPKIDFADIRPPECRPRANLCETAEAAHSAAHVVEIDPMPGDSHVSVQRDGSVPIDTTGIDRPAIQDQRVGCILRPGHEAAAIVQGHRPRSESAIRWDSKRAAIDDGAATVGVGWMLDR